MSYLQTVEDVYARAAIEPDATLCCTRPPLLNLPELRVPRSMLEMNYGCGATIAPYDLVQGDTVLYVGVGGGLEALQFAYFTRRPGGVLAVDPVAAMREKARQNFAEAAELNAWFHTDFVEILDGTALDLPVRSGSVTAVAQNCLFNVFLRDDLQQALREVWRVLKPGGFFASSDPIAPRPLPPAFADDRVARARCLSGCQTLDAYLDALTGAGFGRVEVRARFPYRYLTTADHPSLEEPVLLDSVEIVAYKTPEGADGPAVYTGRTAIGVATDDIQDPSGFALRRGIPVAVSDAVALRLGQRGDIVLTPPTYHARGDGCC